MRRHKIRSSAIDEEAEIEHVGVGCKRKKVVSVPEEEKKAAMESEANMGTTEGEGEGRGAWCHVGQKRGNGLKLSQLRRRLKMKAHETGWN